MAGYRTNNSIRTGASISCAASSTTVIRDPFKVSEHDAMNILVAVAFTSVSVTNAITLKLQDSHDGGTTWADVQTQAVSADTTYEVENNMTAGTDTMMWPLARIVVVTGVGDTCDVDACYVTERT